MPFLMIRNDITKVAADAIVNPANRNLLQGSDTLACITGGIAEAFYGMPQELRDETLKRLPEDIREGYELLCFMIAKMT